MKLFATAARYSVVVSALALASISPAAAGKPEPFGMNFEKWLFSQTDEGKGVINCRATHRPSGRDDILAMRTDGHSYMSVKANGRDGEFPETIIESGGTEWIVDAAANGQRLWFAIDPIAIDTIAMEGGYKLYLGGSEEFEAVKLGNRTTEAWSRVLECVDANGG
jgi:hypothetical protein